MLFLSIRQRQLNFCHTGSRENYFVSVGGQNNNATFWAGTAKNKNIDHPGRESCAMFGLPIQNNSAVIFVILNLCHNNSIFNKIILL